MTGAPTYGVLLLALHLVIARPLSPTSCARQPHLKRGAPDFYPNDMSARHVKQQLTVQGLKQSIRALAELPRNQGWLDLSRKLELLHRRHRDEFQDLIHEGALTRRTAYYLRDVGQLIRRLKLSKSEAERIGWTKLQIIGKHLTPKNADKLLLVAEKHTVHDLQLLMRRKTPATKTHCVLMNFNPHQYRVFENAIKLHGAVRKGRGLVNKEQALVQLISKASPSS